MKMHKVLVVDDDQSVLRAIGRVLKSHGLEFSIANNGDDAMRKLEADSDISVVLIEVYCGKGSDMDGISLARRMRRFGYGTPIVFMFDDVAPHPPRDLAELSPYMAPKPLDEDLLIPRLRAAFDAANASVAVH
jgi:CheY-like chemotaxis protein